MTAVRRRTGRKTGVLAAVVAIVAVAGLLFVVSRGDGSPRPPAPLPAVTLQPLRDTDQAVALRDLRGPLVINLWAQWCGPCRTELPHYQQFHATHPQVAVLGVDWLDPRKEKAVAFAEKVGLTYPLVTDPDKQISARGLPALILVDDTGKVVYRREIVIESLAQLEGLVRKHLGVTL